MITARSDEPSARLRKTSLAMRQILIPAIACSARTRTRASLRLWRFSPSLKSLPLGFFSAVDARGLLAHSRKTPDRCAACMLSENGSAHSRRAPYREPDQARSGLESLRAGFG